MSRFASILHTQESLVPVEVELDTNQGAQAASEAVVDIQNDSAIVDNFDGGLNAAETAIANIDELSSNLQEMQDNGGITEFAEKTAQVALESIMSSLGLTHEIPTTESLSKTNIIATLEEKSESLISRAIAGAKAAFEAVINFIQGLLRNRGALVKYLEGLRQKLASIKDESEIDLTKESRYYSNPTQAVGAINTAEKCITFAEGVGFYLKEIEKAVATGETSVDTEVSERKKWGNHSPDQRFEYIEDFVQKEATKTFGVQEGPVGIVAGAKSLSIGKKNDRLRFSVHDADKGEKAQPDLSDLSEIINKALAAANQLKKLDKVDSALKVFLRNVITGIQRNLNRFQNRNIMDDHKRYAAMNQRFSMIGLQYARVAAREYGTQLPSIAFKNLKAAGDYVKQYIG